MKVIEAFSLTSKLAAIRHLRAALKQIVDKHPCSYFVVKVGEQTLSDCHCATCVAEHALSATCWYEK